ncbi:MAG: metallophosphoesterase, partial [Candidatus Bathyarchaeia archaeon]
MVIADTHLGLRSKKTTCEPSYLNEMLKWIIQLETQENGIVIDSKIDNLKKRVYPPENLVLAGDIIELWDASDRSIYLCSKTIVDRINCLKCELIYLVGNHDYLIGKLQGEYPLSNSKLEIFSEIYPKQSESTINGIQRGDSSYLFLHGHQFDWKFRKLGLAAMAMAYVRDGAEALGAYSWIALIACFLFLGGYSITKLFYIPDSFSIDYYFSTLLVDMTLIKNSFLWIMITIVMAIFSLPRLIVSVGRPAYNKLFHERYNRKRAIDGFLDWWKGFSKKKS